jgi:hypothetical protein
MCIGISAFSQNIQVKGKVVDAETGKPIEMASVVVAGQNLNAKTNNAGEFQLDGVKSSSAITVSIVGYNSQKIVANGSFISVKLDRVAENLTEIVVTALGIKKEKRKLGYSTQEVKGADLVKAREINPINNLVG